MALMGGPPGFSRKLKQNTRHLSLTWIANLHQRCQTAFPTSSSLLAVPPTTLHAWLGPKHYRALPPSNLSSHPALDNITAFTRSTRHLSSLCYATSDLACMARSKNVTEHTYNLIVSHLKLHSIRQHCSLYPFHTTSLFAHKRIG